MHLSRRGVQLAAARSQCNLRPLPLCDIVGELWRGARAGGASARLMKIVPSAKRAEIITKGQASVKKLNEDGIGLGVRGGGVVRFRKVGRIQRSLADQARGLDK